jgi:hypothetical protein
VASLERGLDGIEGNPSAKPKSKSSLQEAIRRGPESTPRPGLRPALKRCPGLGYGRLVRTAAAAWTTFWDGHLDLMRSRSTSRAHNVL